MMIINNNFSLNRKSIIFGSMGSSLVAIFSKTYPVPLGTETGRNRRSLWKFNPFYGPENAHSGRWLERENTRCTAVGIWSRGDMKRPWCFMVSGQDPKSHLTVVIGLLGKPETPPEEWNPSDSKSNLFPNPYFILFLFKPLTDSTRIPRFWNVDAGQSRAPLTPFEIERHFLNA